MNPNHRLLAITSHLTRPVPEPYRTPAKTQKSWATLELDRCLKLNAPGELHIGRVTIYHINQVKVIAVDNQGVTLVVQEGEHIGKTFRWEDREWKSTWAKVAKRKKKGKKN